ncbi:MAG: polysaccharide biosynthesis/export family protein [Fidelibacterota bacterium]
MHIKNIINPGYFFFGILLVLLVNSGMAANDDYKLRVGDKIQITYMDLDENNNYVERQDNFTIYNDGTIQHTIIGKIKLTQLSPQQAESKLYQALEKYYTNPRISLVLLEKSSIEVLLYGAVSNSGIIKTPPGTKVAEFLLTEGKMKTEADLSKIQIISEQGVKSQFSLPDFLYNNDTSQNKPLKNNDKIIVPTYADRNFTNIVADDYVLKFGNVIKIIIYERSKGINGDNSTDILTLDEEGYIYHNLIGKLHLGGLKIETAEQQITQAAREYMQDPVAEISIVNISSRQVYIFGEVNNPGYHPLKGTIKLSEFIAKSAGGIKQTADIKNIIVTRKNGERSTFNFEDFLYDRNDSGNLELEDGDRIIVPPGRQGLSYRISESLRRYYWILQFATTTISLYLLVQNLK